MWRWSFLGAEALEALWKEGLTVTTNTGKWFGYACDSRLAAGGNIRVYDRCLLLHSLSGSLTQQLFYRPSQKSIYGHQQNTARMISFLGKVLW